MITTEDFLFFLDEVLDAIHRGHMEICRDILLSRAMVTVTDPAVHQSDSRYSVE